VSAPVPPVAPVPRAAGRLLCVDDAGAVLLQACVDPAVPDVVRWVPPGGGVELGETPHDAACREAWEELGVTLEDAGEAVVVDVQEFGFDGVRYLATSSCFAVRTQRFEPVPVGMDAAELAFTRGSAWLTPDELEAMVRDGVEVAPSGLADVVRGLHRDLPTAPLRPTARVLVVDRAGRALLMRGGGPGAGFWFPPGGGVDVGEPPVEAARRELVEELGLHVGADDLGPCVWRRRHVLPPSDVDPLGLDIRERWHLLVVDDVPLDHSGWTPLERETIDDVRWWSVEQMREERRDEFSPRALADLLPGLLADHRAGRLDGADPVEVGV
jgi:8-oxo-dGTP pyrophosphatase MutT (NUDIX family)